MLDIKLFQNTDKPQLIKKEEEVKIVLKECCICEDDPSWQCLDYNTNIYKYS
jgi:hypothetical protein